MNTGRRWSWLRSGREHWARMVVVEVRRGTLVVDGRGEDEEKEEEEEEEEDEAGRQLT